MNKLYERTQKDAGKPDSPQKSGLHTIGDICRLTGIEPSRIRFIEREFAEYFESDGNGLFDARQLDLFRRIHVLLFDRAQPPFEIRRELSRDLRSLKIVAVTSGKGGVGKTTVSLNLAISMAARGLRTLLLDADLGLGNVHVFAGIAPRGSMMDLLDGRRDVGELLSPGPGNVQVLCGNSGSARMADLSPENITRLGHELASLGNQFDVMIIDTGAGISTQVLRFLAMADEVVVVTTPNIAATLDGYGIIKVMREESVRGRVHLFVNQADSEGQAGAVSGKIRACCERFLKFTPSELGSALRDPAIEEANQNRKPLALAQPGHPYAKAIARVADTLAAPAPAPEAKQGALAGFETMRVLNGIASTAAA